MMITDGMFNLDFGWVNMSGRAWDMTCKLGYIPSRSWSA